jgi:Protein of unknown function (DUF2911)
MKKIITTLVITTVAMAGALPVIAQQTRADSTGGLSPHETISQTFAGARNNRVTITYGRPYTIKPGTTAVRKIWGGLVPYGKPWRMGADEATTLVTQQPLEMGGKTIPAGAYTLYMMPEENGASKLVISTALGGWGIPVDTKHDLMQVDLTKTTLDKPVDQFTMAISRNPSGGGVLKMSWENTEFSAPFTVQK